MRIRTDLVNKMATHALELAALAFLLSEENKKELAEWLKTKSAEAPENSIKQLFLDIRTFIQDSE